jgi:coproporphyrinogen III oxidase
MLMPADKKNKASLWFQSLRDRICDRFVELERQLESGPHRDLSPGTFERKQWIRADVDGVQRAENGGGEMSVMRGGRVFEKVGVNISTVKGVFSEEFRKSIPGAADTGEFWASGISLVAHMRSPKVPAIHMNTRYIVTSIDWFGGGTDLNPMIENDNDTAIFHKALQECCDRHDSHYYEKYKKWADDYFFIQHRNVARGVGGIFYDNLNSGNFENDFAYTRDVGETFLDIYPKIVEAHMHDKWTDEDRELQLKKRGFYTEFNLVYDRGTLFGLKTGGNIEAILMSLPPEAKWS